MREQRITRLRAVVREYQTADVAIRLLDAHLQANLSMLNEFGVGYTDFRSLSANLESTYLVRLFAEFEAGLRSAWHGAFRRASHPQISDMLNAVAARRLVPQQWLDAAHRVREFRNSLVHEGAGFVAPVGVDDSCEHLCRFLSRLPARW